MANTISALFFAVNNVIIRYFKNENNIAINAFYATTSFFVSLMSLIMYRVFVNPNGFNYNLSGNQIFLLLGNGVLVTLAI